MVKRDVIINNATGLHARPANLLVRESQRWKADIRIKKGEGLHDAKSIMNILTMGALKGDKLTLIVDGEDERDALNSIVELFNNNFGE